MVNLKLLLFTFSFFMLFTIIGETTAEALPLKDTIDDALALVNKAIDEALDKVQEAIEEAIEKNSARTEETINEVFALIENAIDESITRIEKAIDEHTTGIQTINEDEDCELTDEVLTNNIEEAIKAIAKRLGQIQVNVCTCRDTSCGCEATCCECEHTCNECEATQPEEEDCTGSFVAGMVSAYETTDDSEYLTCAEQGGKCILSTANGIFCGDEVFALCRLSQISSDPSCNLWRSAVSDFFEGIRSNILGTEGYIRQFTDVEPSTAVFNLAYYVVAAYYVEAEDRKIWRNTLIDCLSQIDDHCSDFPVMSLGIATWSLATTGPLDDTLIDPYRKGTPYWIGKKLEDLPALLASHQVPVGDLYAGSFYWRFDHDAGDLGSCVSGYIEDTIFATIGLISASQANLDLKLDAAINAACQTLLDAVNSEGKVVEHLGVQNSDSYTFSGEMLLVLSERAANRNLTTTVIELGAQLSL